MTRPSAITPVHATTSSINMILVAESGWGKTVFAGTADRRSEQGGPKALLLVTDPDGTVSAKYQGSTADQWTVRDWDDVVSAYLWMRNEGCDVYSWLVVDSITEMQKIAMKKALQNAVKLNASRDPDIPAIQDYQKVQIQLLNMVKQFNDLPCNVLYTALPMRIEDQDSGDVYYLPSLQGGGGSLAQQVLAYMHIGGFGVFKSVKAPGAKEEMIARRIYFSPVGPYKGKDRYDVLAPYKDNLTLPQMEKLIRGKAVPESSTAPTKRPARRRAQTT